MDPEQIKLLVEEMQRLRETLSGTFTEARQNFESASREAQDSLRDARNKLKDFWKETENDARNVSIKIREALLEPVEEFRDRLHGVFDEFDSRAIGGRDRAMGMFDGIRRLNQGILAGVPFGGLLGVMLYGMFKDEEWRARSEQVGQLVEGATSRSSRLIGQLQGQLRSLEIDMPGITADFAASISAAVEGGFGEGDLEGAFVLQGRAIRNNLVEAAVSIDREFEQAAGTAMRFAQELAINTNSSLEESVHLVSQIGFAARDTGINFQSLHASVMQVTSALRMQTNELGDVTEIASLVARAQEGFMNLRGMSQQRAGALATSAVGGMGQLIAGMSPGMKGYLGERMTGARGVEAIYEVEKGAADPAALALEMLKVAREETTGSPAEMSRFLQSVNGMSVEQAHALIMIGEATKGTFEVSDLTAKQIKELENAFKEDSLKQSEFTRLMNVLIDAVQQMAASVAELLSVGFTGLINFAKMVLDYLSGNLTDTAEASYERLFNRLAERSDKAQNRFMDQAERIGNAIDRGGKKITINDKETEDLMRDLENARRQARSRESLGDQTGAGDVDPEGGWIPTAAEKQRARARANYASAQRRLQERRERLVRRADGTVVREVVQNRLVAEPGMSGGLPL